MRSPATHLKTVLTSRRDQKSPVAIRPEAVRLSSATWALGVAVKRLDQVEFQRLWHFAHRQEKPRIHEVAD